MKRIRYYILFLFCWLSTVAYGQGGPMIVDLGVLPAGNFDYQHTADTRQTSNIYRPDLWFWPESPNDVCYRFVVETPVAIFAHAAMMSTLCNVYIEGYAFGVQDPVMPFQKFENTGHIAAMLPKGLYHIISEGTLNNGVISNGNITTFISATPAVRMQYNFGDFATHFSKEILGDTQRAANAYGNPSRNDIYYYFNLKRPMDVSVSLNSGIDVNLYLLNQPGNELASSQTGLLEAEQLPAGFYFLVVEGKNNDGYFSVDFELTPEESAIDLGKVSGSKTFSETFNTANSENRFGLPANEIFYKLQLTREMSISISSRSSILSDHSSFVTAVYLLDAEENIVQSSQNGIKGLTVENLSPGTYYVVSEGKTQDISIITEISTVYHESYPELGNHNYVLTHTYTETDYSDSRVNIDYFDGLGRPSGTVLAGASPLEKDIVTRQDYDEFGRPSREWLPRVSEFSNGKSLTPVEFESLSPGLYDNDTHPYSMPVYEASPLNRIVEQYGPGQDWHTNGKSVATTYKTNIPGNATLNCKRYLVGGTSRNPTLAENGNYAAGQLYVTEVKDEDGNTSYEFKDKLGQVVLTRQMKDNIAYDTYYVYNDFGDKCFVLPPRIQDEGITQAKLDELAYQYKYDDRRRPTGKKIPGAGWNYHVYDKADRLIFTQDGNLRDKGEWMFTIPDALGRVVLSGTCKNSFDYSAGSLNNVVVKGSWTGGTNANKGYTVSGVTLISPVVLSANYYDSYRFMGINNIPDTTNLSVKYEREAESEGFGRRYLASAKGLLTGTLTAQLTDPSSMPSDYLYSVMYYDDHGRVIQTKTNNHLTGGINKEYVVYDFIGQTTQRKRVHSAVGKPTQTEVYTYAYDHAGRLLTTTHKLNDNEQVVLADNKYDELGRLESVIRNEQDSLKTSYTYNVRSWMKSIYSPLFVQTLYYNERRANGSNTPSYNGNISAMNWELTASEGNKLRGYDFTYDALSRLTAANYLENGVASDKFSTSYEYDKHGNMLSLMRYGNQGTTTYGLIDNLTLAYNGNQLVKVEDTAANPTLSMSMDFRNGTDQATEYTYDANGNQIKDLNKGITNTEYNSLNLPRRITFNQTGSPVNEYVYSAAGVKLSVTHKKLSTEKRTDYVGNMIYENGSLKRILVEGGYIEDGVYHFYVQDHLGNNRVVAKQDGTPIQTNHYYPFGMSFAESTYPDKQPYKYNGKGLDTQNGLNWYDYGARMMNPTIPRFTSMDPMAEKFYSWSPYAYCLGNPMKYVDLNGEIPTPIEGAIIAGHIYDGKIGDVLQGGWRLDRILLNSDSPAYRAGIYSRTVDGVTEYAMANAGTYLENTKRGRGSISEDLEQPLGGSENMEASLSDAQSISRKVGSAELTFVGHSKGGAEAAGNALKTNRNALLYNPAAINLKAYGLDSKSYTGTDKNGMTAYIVKGDALNSLNKFFFAKPIDKVVYLPKQSDNSFINHSIESVIKALKEYGMR